MGDSVFREVLKLKLVFKEELSKGVLTVRSIL